MKMRHICLALTLLCLAAVLTFVLPQQAQAATSGNYTYTVSGGETTITDCSTSVSGAITIPSTLGGYPVTTIGNYAFYKCTSLTSVTIPDSVTTIGDYAFEYCSSLTSVTIPDSVTTIGNRAFSDCTSLISVVIPDSVTSIGIDAFYWCTSLTSIVLGEGVSAIGAGVISGCDSLVGIWVDEDNPIFSNDDKGVLFNKDKTVLIQAPGGLSGAYIIPDSVTSIGERAFDLCSNLTSIVLGDGVTTIGDYALYNCNSLTSIVLGDGVTTIGTRALSGCDSLTGIWANENNPNYSSDDKGVLFNKDKTVLVLAPGGISGVYTIPDGVTTIGDYAFDQCSNLTAVVMNDSVITIGSSAFFYCDSLTSVEFGAGVTTIGDGVFSYCTSLTKISVDEDNPNYSSDDKGCLFNKDKTVLIQFPIRVSGSYTIPSSVIVIGNGAFHSSYRLTSVVIPNGVTTIGNSAFSGCTSLTSVTIPDSVTSIGNSAFYSCSKLTSVVIPDSVTTIGYGAFDACDSLTYNIYDNGKYLGNENNPFFALVDTTSDAITSCKIYEDTNVIAGGAFSWRTGLNSVVIPDSVTTIGYAAFSYCDSLTKVIYCGTEEQWNQIGIDWGNTELTDAARQYHDYQDGVCTICGDYYVAPIEKFDLAGMTMSLGNSLAANFVVVKDNLTGTDNYAVIEKAYADGTTKSVTIPQSQWLAYGETGYYFTYAGVTAKEMTDLITVNVYNGDGVQIMNTYTRTIEDYCYQQILKEEPKNTTASKEKLALYVDILKYGAAAQDFFDDYNITNLATARLSAAQLAYGTQNVSMTDIRVKGDGYAGATLSLKNEISMNFVYLNDTIDQASYAVVSFTDHYGNAKTTTVKAADFQLYGTTGKYIVVNGMSVADCSAKITVTLYKVNGTVLSTTVDSVESYISRMSGAADIYPAIMKLATSAYAYFH